LIASSAPQNSFLEKLDSTKKQRRPSQEEIILGEEEEEAPILPVKRTGSKVSSWMSEYTDEVEENDKHSKVFQGQTAYRKAGCCSRMAFSWSYPIIKESHNCLLHIS